MAQSPHQDPPPQQDDPLPPPTASDAQLESGGTLQPPAKTRGGAIKLLLALLFLYLFMSSINVMGAGLKTIGKENEQWMEDNIFSLSDSHLVALCVGIVITSMVQSSSFTTSLTVTLVAAGSLTLNQAIPIIMGANIGTTVTNTLVSLGSIGRRREFRRAFAASVVHDMFNLCSVLLLFPLNWKFGIIERPANWIADKLEGTAGLEAAGAKSPVKEFLKIVANGLESALEALGLTDPTWQGIVMALLGVVLLFVSLIYMVKMLRSVVLRRVEGLFDRIIFRNGAICFAVGILITAMVQSSSVSTSLVIPLVGAGMLRLRQIFPYTLGANIGTTITALLAALAAPVISHEAHAAAVAVALGHLMFNGMGTTVFWPLSWIPLGMAKAFAKLATRLRYYAVIYTIILFIAVPAVVVVIAAWRHHAG